MRVRLLGPVDVIAGTGAVALPGIRRAAILAALAINHRHDVSADRLIDIVWGGQAPATATNTLQSHISGLRRLLGATAAIHVRGGAYQLDLGQDGTDLEQVHRLLTMAGGQTDPARRAGLLRTALALWRGPALAGVRLPGWLDSQAQQLDALGLRANRDLIELRLAAGEGDELVAELERLTSEYPLDERLCSQLMRALYRAGRQSEALAAYQRLRQALAEQLGLDPGPPLRELQTAVLRHDPALDADAGLAAAAVAPSQLPMAVARFVGRGAALTALDDAAVSSPPNGVVVVCISGTAGVGKTALAVHWAHRMTDHFPDGQLYVNLRGFDPAAPALDSADAVAGFLAALGVPADRVPADLADRTALYRSMLAGRRLLVLLDNARDTAQVRPLLPGAPGCLVVVTSRDRLTPLVALEGAQPLPLDLLSVPEAEELLATRVGAERVSAEPAAVERIVNGCARLPVALAIVAARAAIRPQAPLADLASELQATRAPLTALTGGDPATDMRAIISWSYRRLSGPAAALFHALAAHPGGEMGMPALASLTAVPRAEAAVLVRELVDGHLVEEYRPGRFGLHDLLRAYVREHAAADPVALRPAIRRMLDYYLHCAYAASLVIEPSGSTLLTLKPAAPGVAVEPVDDNDAALAWFRAERQTLVALTDVLAREEHGIPAWHLSVAVSTFLDRQGHWTDMSTVNSLALHAAERTADLRGQAAARLGLGLCAVRLGKMAEAGEHWTAALHLSAASGDRVREARALLNLASLAERRGEHTTAVGHAERALKLYRALGNRTGEARALNSLGWNHAHLGDHAAALARCEAALPLHRADGDLDGEANTWNSIGDIHYDQGDIARATACYRRAAELYRDNGNRHLEAVTLAGLGDCEFALGNRAAAEAFWRRAAEILDDMSHPYAEEVWTRLSR